MFLQLLRTVGRNIREIYVDQKLGIKNNKGQVANICHLGTLYGGWHIPIEIIDAKSICYCVGAGEDISFDCSLIEYYNCNVFTFDPTPKAIYHVSELIKRVKSNQQMPINNSKNDYYNIKEDMIDKLHFYPFGVWSKNETKRFYAPQKNEWVSHSILNLQKTDRWFDAKCLTIKTIMDMLGHDHLDLLKLDIEGAEYEVIRSIINESIKVKLICVEFDEGHSPIDGRYYKRIRDTIRSLLRYGMVPIVRDQWNITFLHRDYATAQGYLS